MINNKTKKEDGLHVHAYAHKLTNDSTCRTSCSHVDITECNGNGSKNVRDPYEDQKTNVQDLRKRRNQWA